MTWPRYFSYRATGAEFITELPGNWSIRSLKSLAAVPVANGVGEPGTFDNPDWPRYVRITDIASARSLRTDTFASLPPETAADAELLMGDLLLAAVGASFGKSYLHTQDIGPACFAGFMVRFRCGRDILPEYASFWTESAQYWGQVRSRVVQSTIQNFSASRYGALWVPLPPIGDQRAIVSFLDRETAKIDALIAEQERLIALLQEKRQAVISHAVTKGLDPNVPMKESGVAWLGDVPAHWESTRYKNVLQEKHFVSGALLPAGAISFGRVVFKDDAAMNAATKATYQEVLRGEFLVNPINLNYDLKSLRTALSDIDTCVSPAYLVLQPKRELELSYFKYQLFVFDIRHMKTLGAGVRQTIGFGDIGPCRIQLPPLLEQRTIATFLDRVTAEIDALTTEAESVILLLRERRTTLITAAVTGQIDVRGLGEAAA